MEHFELNRRAADLIARKQSAQPIDGDRSAIGWSTSTIGGATWIDCGVANRGSLAAADLLTRVCLSDLAAVQTTIAVIQDKACPKITVSMDRPYVGGLLSQYAGWKVSEGKFFAMASGPMRAIYAHEPIFAKLGYRESANCAIGVLETSKSPTDAVVAKICENLNLAPSQLTLLGARTASLAGSYQVVARSVETCLHKLSEIGFDVKTVVSAIGSSYLPPIPKDDLIAIGRTNDSILYGSDVLLWLDCEDAVIESVGPKVPASASKDYGDSFLSIFERFGRDFYAIDPLLFSPARVTFHNLRTGTTSTFGRIDESILLRSFFGASE